jgi:DUF4097 and DUF4098 domain-containing protein YvlB
MAAQPPPYSPRDAARAQQYYRRSLRRPSLVGPLVLIIVGVIALLVETNNLNVFHLWDWYMRWWPLLLIGVGLLSLAEWWFDGQRSRTDRRFYRSSHGGMIALILCLALFGYLGGSTGYGFHGIHIFGRGSEDADFFAHLMGQEHDDNRNLNEPIPPGAQVEIQVPHGDVSITASGDDQIHVQAHLVVYAANNRAARRNLDALAPRLTVNGNSVTLRASDRNDGRADLTIEIPKGAVASVSAGHGDVTLEGLAGAANVSAGRGDVKADNLGGPLQVQMAKGDFSAHSIAGDLTLKGRMDDVSVSDVQGATVLEGDFFGDTNVAHITTSVHFHSSRTDVQLVRLPGNLSIDSGDLQLNNAVGPARISTNAKDVGCTGIAGELRVEDGDGDISVGLVPPLGESQIHNRNGEINLTLPKSAGFRLQATAKNGNIDSKLDLPVNTAGGGQSVSGQVGEGGPSIVLAADHGDIAIATTEAELLPPTPPAPPIPPGPPGSKTMRHLHSSKNAGPVPDPVIQ